jgi:hypothetical protein
METYKWLYNLILLNLYYLCLSSLIKIQSEFEDEDLIQDLHYKKEFYFYLVN